MLTNEGGKEAYSFSWLRCVYHNATCGGLCGYLENGNPAGSGGSTAGYTPQLMGSRDSIDEELYQRIEKQQNQTPVHQMTPQQLHLLHQQQAMQVQAEAYSVYSPAAPAATERTRLLSAGQTGQDYSTSPAPAAAAAASAQRAGATTQPPKSVYCLNYIAGSPCRRFAMHIPGSLCGGMVLRVDLGGEQHSVQLPMDVVPGETVVVVAPL